jgi:uncharacterized protein (DUF2062 family)
MNGSSVNTSDVSGSSSAAPGQMASAPTPVAMAAARLPGKRLVKRANYYWRRTLRVRATPHEVALGCAAGVFAGCTPFLGFQMMLAGAIAVLLRVSVPAALLGTFVSNPLSWPAIWAASLISGAWMLGRNPVSVADYLADRAMAFSTHSSGSNQPLLDVAMVNLAPILQPLVVGGLLIGLLAALASYYPTRRAVRIYQRRRGAR